MSWLTAQKWIGVKDARSCQSQLRHQFYTNALSTLQNGMFCLPTATRTKAHIITNTLWRRTLIAKGPFTYDWRKGMEDLGNSLPKLSIPPPHTHTHTNTQTNTHTLPSENFIALSIWNILVKDSNAGHASL